MTMKYVVYLIAKEERVIIFDEHHSHQNIMFSMNIPEKDILSAGNIELTADYFKVFGESTTLRKFSRKEEDKELILESLN
jgi:hypothetical protein